MEKCSQMISTGAWSHRTQCSRNSVVVEDGKPWCRQHAPSSVKARNEKSMANLASWRANAETRHLMSLVGAKVTVLTVDHDGDIETMVFPGEVTLEKAVNAWAKWSAEVSGCEEVTFEDMQTLAEQDCRTEVCVTTISPTPE